MGKRSRKKDEVAEDEVPVDEPSEELPPREPTVELDVEAAADDPDPLPEGPEPTQEAPRGEEGETGRRQRVMRFAKRLMDRRELSTDTREILGTVLATSDKAKTEAVRMVAREVRSYLDALELKEDLKELITSYSLEISLSLKPLEHAVAAAESEGESPTAEDVDQESRSG